MKQVQYNKLLVTHDGSRLAASALSHALFLAQKLHAEMLLFRVIESVGQEVVTLEPMGMAPAVPIIGTTAVEVVKENKKLAKKQLERVKLEFEKQNFHKIDIRIGEGLPAHEIVALVKKEKVDLIIMATHGRSGLGRVLLGSVADYVVRHASCPVLLVRPQK